MSLRHISEVPEGAYALVVCVDGEVVGDLTWRLILLLAPPDVGEIGMGRAYSMARLRD